MVCVPTDKVETARVPTPLVRLLVPIELPLSLKVTLPVAFEGETEAVRVTV
jgi:hypothetical protein